LFDLRWYGEPKASVKARYHNDFACNPLKLKGIEAGPCT
jgi:hypothetical protein